MVSRLSLVRFVSMIGMCLFITISAQAHPGGLDDNGGHVNRVTGKYHCHKNDCEFPTNVTTKSRDFLTVVSFNIQFLGHFKHRDNEALAAILSPYDILVIQELVAPPFDGTFPDENPYRPDKESADFFEAMAERGFDFVLSEEDTGSGDKIHNNGPATEWWVTFYKPDLVEPVYEIPQGFLDNDRSNNPDYKRVPYASAFRTIAGGNDFVLISVHLNQGDSEAAKEKREKELKAVASWVGANDAIEKDFFILGDMNFENCEEITAIIPSGYKALNNEDTCVMTNTHTEGHPYDNVLLPADNQDILADGGQFRVIDLIEAMRVPWYEDFTQPYPGDPPYNHNAFRVRYSDHHPIQFRLLVGPDDD